MWNADGRLVYQTYRAFRIRNPQSEFLIPNGLLNFFKLRSNLFFVDRSDVELVVGIQTKTLNIFVHGGVCNRLEHINP